MRSCKRWIGRCALLCAAVFAIQACSGGDAEATGRPNTQTMSQDAQGNAGVSTAAALAEIRIGDRTLTVELADDAEERGRGLMFRESLTDYQGMLFIYPDETVHSFWMKNVPIALDIAFIDGNQRIVEIQTMEPNTSDYYTSSGSFMYAVEVRAGWFEEYGIRVGTQVQF